jgi:hypothetical protein
MSDELREFSGHSSKSSSSSSSSKAEETSRFKFNSLIGIALVFTTIMACHSLIYFVDLCRTVLQDSQTTYSVVRTSTTTTTTTRLSESQLHFCRVPKVVNLQQHANSTPFILQYQCAGKPYEDFSKKLLDFATSSSSSSSSSNNHSTAWGRRDFPLPPNKTVLIFGNSHLRQVSKTLVCQYAHAIESFEVTNADAFTIRFSNNSTWISITNSPIAYSYDWKYLLEHHHLGGRRSMESSLDAVVLGKFNLYEEAKHTAFERTMRQEQQASFVQGLADFETIPPPSLKEVAEAYSGPIVSVSMFSQYDQKRVNQQQQQQQLLKSQQHKRDNLWFVDSRAYISQLGECGSDDKLTVGTCHEPGDVIPNSNRNPADMHRCTGADGGHADLIAWDIVETLYQVVVHR